MSKTKDNRSGNHLFFTSLNTESLLSVTNMYAFHILVIFLGRKKTYHI